MIEKRKEFFMKLQNKLFSECGLCNKDGWVPSSLSDSVFKACSCRLKFEMYIESDDSGIDKEYWDLDWSDWRGDELAKRKVQEYIEHLDSAYENGLGMVFYGRNGVGKTFLSTQILKTALQKGKSIRFLTMAETVALMKSKIDDENDEEFYEKSVKNVEFLCLDNLGAEYQPKNFGSYTLAEFDILARHRRRQLFPTILTTNLSMDEFKTLYGSSISSLFSACSQFISVEGKDFRSEQGKGYADKLRGL